MDHQTEGDVSELERGKDTEGLNRNQPGMGANGKASETGRSGDQSAQNKRRENPLMKNGTCRAYRNAQDNECHCSIPIYATQGKTAFIFLGLHAYRSASGIAGLHWRVIRWHRSTEKVNPSQTRFAN
jgi:hypothetical protein